MLSTNYNTEYFQVFLPHRQVREVQMQGRQLQPRPSILPSKTDVRLPNTTVPSPPVGTEPRAEGFPYPPPYIHHDALALVASFLCLDPPSFFRNGKFHYMHNPSVTPQTKTHGALH